MTEKTDPAAHNQTNIPHDAGEYMAGLGGEIVSPMMIIGWAERAKDPESKVPSQDAVYAYVDAVSGKGRFGLLDGAGGHDKGREAALAGRQDLHEGSLNDYNIVAEETSTGLDQIFDNMAAKVTAEAYGGITTASLGLVNTVNEKPRFEWGAVGDSPIFLIRNGNITQLNKEETVRQQLLGEGASEAFADRAGGTLTNALGTRLVEGQPKNTYKGLRQHDNIDIEEGDIIVFVSDGITGDTATQRLPGGNNLETILGIMSQPNVSPQEKADTLVRIARKHDDRSVLVIEFGKKSNTNVESTDDEDTIDFDPEAPMPPRAPERLGRTVVKNLGK